MRFLRTPRTPRSMLMGMRMLLLAVVLTGCGTAVERPEFLFSRVEVDADAFEQAADVWRKAGVSIRVDADGPLIAARTFPGQHPDYGPVPGVGIPGDRDEATDLAHAFGHMVGLGHFTDGCTMAATPCWSETLSASELAALR